MTAAASSPIHSITVRIHWLGTRSIVSTKRHAAVTPTVMMNTNSANPDHSERRSNRTMSARNASAHNCGTQRNTYGGVNHTECIKACLQPPLTAGRGGR